MVFHNSLTVANGIHQAHSYTYATLAAMNAATGFATTDGYKLAFVQEDYSTYVLHAITGGLPTWIELNRSSSSLSLRAYSSISTSVAPLLASATEYFSTSFVLDVAKSVLIEGLAGGSGSNGSIIYRLYINGVEYSLGAQAFAASTHIGGSFSGFAYVSLARGTHTVKITHQSGTALPVLTGGATVSIYY